MGCFFLLTNSPTHNDNELPIMDKDNLGKPASIDLWSGILAHTEYSCQLILNWSSNWLIKSFPLWPTRLTIDYMQPCQNYCFRPVKAGSGASIDHGEKRDNDRVVGTRLFFTSADFKSNGIISTKDISYCKKTFPTCLLTWMRLLMTDVILLDAPYTHTKKKTSDARYDSDCSQTLWPWGKGGIVGGVGILRLLVP